jgi:hypothetical protein
MIAQKEIQRWNEETEQAIERRRAEYEQRPTQNELSPPAQD